VICIYLTQLYKTHYLLVEIYKMEVVPKLGVTPQLVESREISGAKRSIFEKLNREFPIGYSFITKEEREAKDPHWYLLPERESEAGEKKTPYRDTVKHHALPRGGKTHAFYSIPVRIGANPGGF
jgi:hypothetical protein